MALFDKKKKKKQPSQGKKKTSKKTNKKRKKKESEEEFVDSDYGFEVDDGVVGFNPEGKLAMYANLAMDWLAGAGIDQATKLSDVSIETRYDRTRTANGSTQFWILHGMPVDYQLPLVRALRMKMFSLYPDVELKFALNSYPVTRQLNVKSDYFRNRMAAAEQRFSIQREILEQGSETGMTTGVTLQKFGSKLRISPEDIKRNQDMYESYYYTYNRVDAGGAVFQSYMMISANFGKMSRREMRQFEKAMADFLGGRRQGMFYYKVTGKVKTALSTFGVTGAFTKVRREQFGYNLFTDENLATMIPFSDYGLQGGRGYLFGLDIMNNNPFILPVTETGDRQVWLCVAPPGGSKTYLFGNGTVFGALANNHHVSVFDIKGKEYDPLMAFTDAIKLDFSAKSGNFVNTLRIDDLPQMDKAGYFEAYLDAIQSTVGWLVTMTNLTEKEGNITDLETFFTTVIENYYAAKKVNPKNPHTFINSKSMRITDIPMYMNMVYEGLNPESLQKGVASVAIERCIRALAGESDKGNMFKKEVTIAEVLDTPLVIYSFGMNSGEYLGVEAGIKAHMANAIDTKKEYYRKQEQKFTTAIYEELNSCRFIPGFVQQVGNRVVRSRSNNVNIGMIMNSPQVLMEPQFSDIKSNISMVMAGALVPADLDVLDQIGASALIDFCNRIRDDQTGKYKHVFAVWFDTGQAKGSTMIRAEYPDEIHEVLGTRTIEDASF